MTAPVSVDLEAIAKRLESPSPLKGAIPTWIRRYDEAREDGRALLAEVRRLREALESVRCGYSESERPKSCNAECVARAALGESRQ